MRDEGGERERRRRGKGIPSRRVINHHSSQLLIAIPFTTIRIPNPTRMHAGDDRILGNSANQRHGLGNGTATKKNDLMQTSTRRRKKKSNWASNFGACAFFLLFSAKSPTERAWGLGGRAPAKTEPSPNATPSAKESNGDCGKIRAPIGCAHLIGAGLALSTFAPDLA